MATKEEYDEKWDPRDEYDHEVWEEEDDRGEEPSYFALVLDMLRRRFDDQPEFRQALLDIVDETWRLEVKDQVWESDEEEREANEENCRRLNEREERLMDAVEYFIGLDVGRAVQHDVVDGELCEVSTLKRDQVFVARRVAARSLMTHATWVFIQENRARARAEQQKLAELKDHIKASVIAGVMAGPPPEERVAAVVEYLEENGK